MHNLTIGEVAKASGFEPSAIRYYEKLGLLAKPMRVGGKRRYDHRILERLAILRFAKHVGFRIAEIKLLLDGFEGRPAPERWRALARGKLNQIEDLLSDAAAMKKLLRQSLHHRCPKLVERGAALKSAPRQRWSRQAFGMAESCRRSLKSRED